MTNLIPIAYIHEVCMLSQNIDPKKIQITYEMAQDEFKAVIGGEFYDQLITQVSTTPTTFSADNQALYDPYIKKYLAWQTYFYFLKFANSDSTPTGVRKFNDENSSLLSDIEMYSKEKNVLEILNKYKGDMITFLKLEQSKDTTKYPLYESSCVEVMSFSITAIDKNSDTLIRVNRSLSTNE